MKNVEIVLYRSLSTTQGIYTFVTALWPLLHIDSFVKVTGPKTDIWLVKTVAVLLIPIGLCFLVARHIQKDHWVIILLGTISAAGLAFIDFYYTANDTIRWVYALDGIAQIIFLLLWIHLYFNQDKLRKKW